MRCNLCKLDTRKSELLYNPLWDEWFHRSCLEKKLKSEPPIKVPYILKSEFCAMLEYDGKLHKVIKL